MTGSRERIGFAIKAQVSRTVDSPKEVFPDNWTRAAVAALHFAALIPPLRALLRIGFLVFTTFAVQAQPFVGCFKDQGDPVGTTGRDLSGSTFSDAMMTIERCIDVCRAGGFTFAGTQFGSHCFCGNNYGTSGMASNCNVPCVGNSSQTCGGTWANSVYVVIADGNLYRESSFPEVYVLQGNKKIWVPTTDALFALGKNWNDVKVVSNGSLNRYPRVNIP